MEKRKKNNPGFDLDRCSEQIPNGGGSSFCHRCTGTAVENGKCRWHSASTRDAKRKAEEARWAHERKQRDARRAVEAIEREIVDAVVMVRGNAALIELRDRHIAAVAALKDVGATPKK